MKLFDKRLSETVKNFLLTVFVIMCITALFICTGYAKNNNIRTIDGSEAPVITREHLTEIFYGFFEGIY